MSMHHSPVFGFFISMDEVVGKLGTEYKEIWQDLNTSPAEVNADVNVTKLGEKLEGIFKHWEIMFVDDECDLGASSYVESGNYYLKFDWDDLYECHSKPLLDHLMKIGLIPTPDQFCVFG